jgi:hypothetical protein
MRVLPKLCASPAPLHQYHGGNLSVIPSQESPQIHAISPPSLRASVVRAPYASDFKFLISDFKFTLPSLSPRMCILVDPLQSFNRNMGVDLGR